ncbi:MAG: hypothetical protein KKG47_09555 [Proteobacteria bacterium]|nr:hypothetical protein [Pseudomonadota bacterium]MBU1736863.1 hypothetical protein [Pseudomonadota bacterium]
MKKQWFTFLGIFLCLFILFQLLFISSIRGSGTYLSFIHLITVKPGAFLIGILIPDEKILVSGLQILSRNTGLKILNGCEGIEGFLLITCGILSYQASLWKKLVGVSAGLLLMESLNLMRVVSLFFTLRQQKPLFSLLHGYVWPTLILAIGTLYFLWWSDNVTPVETDAA